MAAAPSPVNGNDVGLLAAVIAGGGFVLQLLIAFGTAIWTLGRSKNATDDRISAKGEALTSELSAAERRMQDAVTRMGHDSGEMGQALRQKIVETDQKITQTELWNRDNFVRKQTFEVVTGDLRRTLEKLVDRVDERFDRLENKLDSKAAK
jgi:hypothetical protein